MDERRDSGEYYPGGRSGGEAPERPYMGKVDCVNLGEVGESYTLKAVKEKLNQVVRAIAPKAVCVAASAIPLLGMAAVAPLYSAFEDIPGDERVVTNVVPYVEARIKDATNALVAGDLSYALGRFATTGTVKKARSAQTADDATRAQTATFAYNMYDSNWLSWGVQEILNAATNGAVRLSDKKPEENARLVLWDSSATWENPQVAHPTEIRVGDLVAANYEVVSNAAMSVAAATNDFLRLTGGTMTGDMIIKRGFIVNGTEGGYLTVERIYHPGEGILTFPYGKYGNIAVEGDIGAAVSKAAAAATNYTDWAIGTNNAAFVEAVLAAPIAGADASDLAEIGEYGSYGTVGAAILALIAGLAALKRGKADKTELPYEIIFPVTPANGVVTVGPRTIAIYPAGDSAAAFTVAVGTGTAGRARDCELVIDCTATGAVAPTVTWPATFHPRTDAATDFACKAGKRNVYFISEYDSGEFAVGGWQETAGGNAS